MKNVLIGISLLMIAVFLWIENVQEQQRLAEKKRLEERQSTATNETNSTVSLALPEENGNATNVRNQEKDTNASENEIIKKAILTEKIYDGLESVNSQYSFSSIDGAISQVQLKKSGRLSKSYNMVFHNNGESAFSMSFEDEGGDIIRIPGHKRDQYEINNSIAGKKVILQNNTGPVQITREYARETNSSYLIRHKTTVRNTGETTLSLSRIRMGLGTTTSIQRLANPFYGTDAIITVGYYNSGAPKAEGCTGCNSCMAECSGRIDGEAEEFFRPGEMGEENLLRRTLTSAKWACVNNQFFVNILMPVRERDAVILGREIKIVPDGNSTSSRTGITGSISVPFGSLGPGESRSVEFLHYAGPKDYVGLTKLGHEQDKVMDFGVLWWISEPLNWSLNKLESFLGNFGLAIIALTILMKLILWPLTAQATRSQKRMQALQEPMSKLREKYKGDTQKLNQEMMKFYKEEGVNPFAGCWPILVQMPIFLGMFWMLRSASELYGQEFLWINDLSEQDNIAMVSGFSINILPLLMLATQWYQMKLTPMQLGPDASESQRINAKMMRMMPFIFLVFLYFFSSALVLYWTAQNLMSILQTLVTKQGKSPQEIALENKAKEQDSTEQKARARDADFVDEEERRHRRTLGLKMHGEIKKRQIEEIYRTRIKKYHPDKINNLGPKRQTEALKKKERLQDAYEFMLKKISEGT